MYASVTREEKTSFTPLMLNLCFFMFSLNARIGRYKNYNCHISLNKNNNIEMREILKKTLNSHKTLFSFNVS